MEWWLWFLAGFALLALELFTPGGFFVLFFGIGAMLVGALVGVGVPLGGAAQWLLFTVLSALLLVLVRPRLVSRVRTEAREVDQVVGEVAVVVNDLQAGGVGQVELRGTAWSARNTGGTALRKGQRVRVERVDGLMLSVRAE
jgi:membrane protein implicated in regulation of membrane protease activity